VFFDVAESRAVAWGRRLQAAALVAALADLCRGWDAIVVGECERAFYGAQYALMAPLFEHYGVIVMNGTDAPTARNLTAGTKFWRDLDLAPTAVRPIAQPTVSRVRND
jgi:hypothetical protein